ncbi:MAG: hypothetical protein KatS3mg131_4005 [Candidatus Tectimicrobiota bacterium]|nr:MAG: hypothetical protein KatS3mg131_4005 [Candidatus Tectomicrobia bacterium]
MSWAVSMSPLLGLLLAAPLWAAAARPPFDISDAPWRTDFSRHTVPLEEIISGGPPRDGIPPIDKPVFVTPAAANGWLRDREPVVAVAHRGEAKAYPLQILIWHEIVNDQIGGDPVAVTFCPLCNSAIAFDRRLEGMVLDFGTTGRLRHSDLIMWDRQTESWWQQLTGEAIVGTLAGKRLAMLPASIVSYAAFKETYPQGKVLSRDTGFHRDYGRNPYYGYDDIDSTPFLFRGPLDGRLPPMERVVAVSLGGVDKAYPYRLLAEQRVVYDTVGGQRLVVLYSPGTASALDRSEIAASRDVGATGVFVPEIDGRSLTLAAQGPHFVDRETGSTWNVMGKALAGPLAGRQLPPVLHGDHFAFAWLAFKPQTQIYAP